MFTDCVVLNLDQVPQAVVFAPILANVNVLEACFSFKEEHVC